MSVPDEGSKLWHFFVTRPALSALLGVAAAGGHMSALAAFTQVARFATPFSLSSHITLPSGYQHVLSAIWAFPVVFLALASLAEWRMLSSLRRAAWAVVGFVGTYAGLVFSLWVLFS